MESLAADRLVRADVHEPGEIIGGFAQTNTPFKVGPFNSQKHSDYHWWSVKEEQVEIERKTWGEIVGDLDRVEKQLQTHLLTFPDARHIILLEGGIIQSATGCQVLQPRGKWLMGGFESRRPLSSLYAWLYRVSSYFEIVPTVNVQASAVAITSMFNADGKAESDTLKRNIKHLDFDPDPFITQIMGAFPGVGQARAIQISRRFGSLFEIANATPGQLVAIEGFGPTM
ncbi:hypothetical protein LCGC14_2607140, partial [marine sediment metagenome]